MNEYQSHCPVCQYQFNGDENDPRNPTVCPNDPRVLLVDGPRTQPTSRFAHTIVSRALGESPPILDMTAELGPVGVLVDGK